MPEVIPTLSPLKRLIRLLHLERRHINFIYLYAAFAGLINLTLPLGIQAFLNFLQAGAVSASWWMLIVAITLGTALAGLLVVFQMSVSETLERRIFTYISFDFASRLPLLQTEIMRHKHLPEIVNRFFDTLTLQKGLPKILIDVSSALLQICFGLLLLSFYHPLFIFFGLTLLLMLFIIFRVSAPLGLKTSLKESKYKYEVAYWLEEVARALQTFKLAGSSDLPVHGTDERVSKYLDAKKSLFRVLMYQFSAVVVFKSLITFVLLSLGGWLVLQNQINVGQFVAAEIVIILIMNSAEKLILSLETIYNVLTSIEKLGSVADLPLEPESGVDFKQVNSASGIAVDIRNLTFRYPGSGNPVINNLDLSIPAGQKLCIAGYNGSGKSTLIQVISCFTRDFEGQLLYNGLPSGNIHLRSLRNTIGDFSQLEDIFEGTILDNISLGHAQVDLQAVMAVCSATGLSEYISGLPEGYNTRLLPGGKNLSRSIAARIILARSIVSNPKLLTVEEPMANLERQARIRLASLLTAPDRQWTLVVVSDDAELASRCDRVVVLKDGAIVADGPFDQIRKTEHGVNLFRS